VCVNFSKLVWQQGLDRFKSITTSLGSIASTIPSSRPASGRVPRAAEVKDAAVESGTGEAGGNGK
jgi:hypothetical protein